MNEKLNTESVRQLLNRSSARIASPTLASLRAAREKALVRYDARSSVPAFAWATALVGSGNTAGPMRRHYYWASIILLAACLFSATNFMMHALEHDDSEVDVAILTDDLPIDVYVD